MSNPEAVRSLEGVPQRRRGIFNGEVPAMKLENNAALEARVAAGEVCVGDFDWLGGWQQHVNAEIEALRARVLKLEDRLNTSSLPNDFRGIGLGDLRDPTTPAEQAFERTLP